MTEACPRALAELDFLIIGGQRSASTYLHHCLQEHPQLFLPRGEVSYFEDPSYGKRDPEYIRRLFARARPLQLRGFKRPELLSRPECPERIARDAPGVRLVAVLREPIRRTVSAYFHYMAAGVIPLAPLNVGLRRILRGEHDRDFPMARQVIDYSRYGEHLRRYLGFFARKSIFVVLDDDFRRDAGSTLQGVHAFLGVRPDFIPSQLSQSTNAGVYSLRRLRLLRLGSRFIYKYRPGTPYVDLQGNGLSRGAYQAVRLLDRIAVGPFIRNEPPELDDDVRSHLSDIFAPDLDELQGILGRSLDHWRVACA